MELLILNTLDWRMRSITPFSFLHFFLSSLDLNDRPFTQALRNRASVVIFNAHNEIKFVEFKPSIIAASAVLSTCHELLPPKFPPFKASLSSFQYVNKIMKGWILCPAQEPQRAFSTIAPLDLKVRTPLATWRPPPHILLFLWQ
ncbi:hypothetical protein C1H46_040477 [Malus baccata]|uniref:Cyclin C-terminal domain-containing protein n=1 Tax=Malus baccata TaxID=106549 RepID=A0A540KID2_MALBA|nr:hypothetical protein C1H46_040477 [Malus baccata]